MTPAGQAAVINCVRRVQDMPYTWPAPPDAASTRAAGIGTCAGKHAVLAEDLAEAGFYSRPILMIGPLAPPAWTDLAADNRDLQEVHECLTVETAWAGPLLVDITWHPAAIRAGLRGTTAWTGHDDMLPALEPTSSYAVSRQNLRTQKEALRARLYTPQQRERRDTLLAEIARRANVSRP